MRRRDSIGELPRIPVEELASATGGSDALTEVQHWGVRRKLLCAEGAFNDAYLTFIQDRPPALPKNLLELRSDAIDACDANVAYQTGDQNFLKNSMSLKGLVPDGTTSPPFRP